MSQQRKIIILLIVAVVMVGIIALVIYSLIPRASILFSVAPEEVRVTINGSERNIKSGDRVTVSPGETTVEVSRDEFNNYSEVVTLENGDEYEVLVALEAQTAAAEALLATDHSQLIIQRIAGRDLKNGAEELRAAYPVLEVLPIVDRFYKVIVCESKKHPDDKTKLALCVQLFELAARQSALAEIKRRGYNPSDYEVIFQDFTYKTLQRNAGE